MNILIVHFNYLFCFLCSPRLTTTAANEVVSSITNNKDKDNKIGKIIPGKPTVDNKNSVKGKLRPARSLTKPNVKPKAKRKPVKKTPPPPVVNYVRLSLQ